MNVKVDEVRIASPEFRGANLALGACRDIEACLDGAAGCIAGESRIYNPVTGEHVPVKELYEKKIAPIVQTLMGAIQAEVPFRKGVANLYRVTLASGRQCVVTGNHLVLTPEGWRFVSSCAQGSRLLISEPCPRQTTEVFGLSVSLQDALRLSQTPLGSQEYYSAYHYHGDEQLQSVADNDLTAAPSQGDAHEHNHADLYEGDQDALRGYNHQHRQYVHHARTYCSPSSGDREHTLSHVQQGTSLQDCALSQYDVLSQIETRLPLPIALPLPDGDSRHLHAPSLEEYRAFEVNLSRDVSAYSIPEQLVQCFSFFDTTQGLSEIPLQWLVYNPSFDTSNAINTSIKFDYTASWDTVSSIQYVRTDEYFDLHVPNAEHYLAEGIWHHNTGKTYAALFKVHMLLTLYPGAKALVARKTNTALAGSAVATYRDMIQPEEGIRYFGGNRIRPAAFEYPNGSSLIVNGLDKPEKIKSWEFSIAYLNECTELTVEDLEFVRSRLRQGKTPYPQIIMDCNPGSPIHWLNVRMNEGKTTRLLSTHEDNPRYFDAKTNDWTEAGREYIFSTLEGLTGVRLSRLRYGLWCSADGAIYEKEWNRSVNVVKRFTIPRTWRRWISIDFGYTNPFVCQWWAADEDNRLYRYREIYHTGKLVEDHALDIAIASGWFHLLPTTHEKYKPRPDENADPLPQAIICDHDIEDRKTLERHLRLNTIAAKKTVSDGIQAVASRLRPAGDGKPRLLFLEDSLVERDRNLADKKKPTCFEEEIESYVWKQGSTGPKEEPVKEDDHSQDSCRYMCSHLDLQPAGVSYFKNIWK